MDLSVLDQACHSGQLVGGGPPTTDGNGQPLFGVNVDFSEVPVYANLLRHSQGFTPANGASSLPVDQWNCPQADFAVGLIPTETIRGANGDTYAVQFSGQATIRPAACSISQQAYNSATNTTTAVLLIPAGSLTPGLVFTNTRRQPADTTATGIDTRTLTIMLPIVPGGTTYHDPSEKWNRAIVAALAPWKGGYWRDVDTGYINNVPDLPAQTPANRTMPYWACQGVTSPTRGFCFEDRVEFSNFLGMGLWTNFPDTGTPDLFQLYLNIVKFGSDATGTPYTAAGGSNPVPSTGPVHPPLAGIFLWEQGNENWNPNFAQLGRYGQRGVAERASLNTHGEITGTDANGNPYSDPGGSNPPPANAPAPLDPLYCVVAADLLANADLAAATFPGGLNVKYFPILCTQTGNSPTLYTPMTWLRRHLAARGQAVAQNIAACGGDGYEAFLADQQGTAQTVDQIFAGGIYGRPGFAADANTVQGYGLPHSSYEGGLAVNATAIGDLASLDPRIRPVIADRAVNEFAAGCRFITVYALIRGEWSILDTIQDLTHPKWLGWSDAIAHYPMDGRTPVPFSSPAAPSLADGSFEQAQLGQVANGFQYAPAGSGWTWANAAGINGPQSGFISGGQLIPHGDQIGFIQGTGQMSQVVAGWGAGPYRVTGQMNARTGNGGLPFDVLIDGAVVGTLTPTPGQFFVPFATPAFTVTAGTHTVALRTTSNQDLTVLLDDLAIMPAGAVVPVTPSKLYNGIAAGSATSFGSPAF